MRRKRKVKFKRELHAISYHHYTEYSDSKFIELSYEICVKMGIEFVDFKSENDDCILTIKCNKKEYSLFIVEFAKVFGDYVSMS